ncbi:extracellular solute-binding protein [Leifsonia sp. AG29]|uniref:extracellular solute-binding protein n=1 Tax=Leifsonia sp. AG29 TaxID=2598860 RepID=UPI00131B3747|nr:extracellular solute-binding protein [Leifsonia sp. AG29]
MSSSWNKLFARYEKENPGVHVVFTGYDATTYPTVLKTGLSGSNGPDLVMLHPYSSIKPYVDAGQIQPLTTKEVPGLATAFTPDSLAASKVDGKQYGVPFAQQTVQVFYNKDIFSKVGVKPPATPREVEPMLKKLAAAGYTPISVTGKDSWQLVNVFDALDGPTYGGRKWVEGARAGKAHASDPAFVSALDQFKALSKYFPQNVTGVNYADSQALFSSGKAALFPGGSWELAGFESANPSLKIGVFSMPTADGKTPTWGYEDGSIGLSAKSAHSAAAIKLMNWMTTAEFGEAFTNELKQVSSVKGVKVSDPVLNQMITDYQAAPVPMIWVTDYFGVSSPAPYAALMNGAQGILLGTQSPTQVGAAIDQSITQFTQG